MATAIRAIPTLYGETARHFELEAAETEENPGTLDYTHEAEIVMEYLKCTVETFSGCSYWASRHQ